jgi:hypothetical protein
MTNEDKVVPELATLPNGKLGICLLYGNVRICGTIIDSPNEAERLARDLLNTAAAWRRAEFM